MAHALLVIGAGVCAALHVGKLPPAIDALRAQFGLELVEAGLLLSIVQLAGMSLGLAVGSWVDGLGHARGLRAGSLLMVAAGTAGAFASSSGELLFWRAVEGLGFLLTVLAAPSWVRRLVPPSRVATMMGLWGVYMPLGVALGLVLGPQVITLGGWRLWSLSVAAVTAVMVVVVAWIVPTDRTFTLGGAPIPERLSRAGVAHAAREDEAAPAPAFAQVAVGGSWRRRFLETVTHRGPWLAALGFAAYASQWLAVVGFLPTIYAGLGASSAVAGLLTAAVCLANVVGNLVGAALVHRGHRAERLIGIGFAVMALGGVFAYAHIGDAALPMPWRYAAAFMFSLVGGLVPSSLFSLASRLAPNERTLASTVGWMQQWSALGQFGGPPLVGWVAGLTQGWQNTWMATGALSVVGLVITALIARHPGVRVGSGVASREPIARRCRSSNLRREHEP